MRSLPPTLALASLPLVAACHAPAGLLGEHDLAFEAQAYPAGLQTTVTGLWDLGDTDVLTVRAGWNETDRRDWGEHDDETGGGPGIGAGWRRYESPARTGWMYGAYLDVWDLDIDWDEGGTAGKTEVLVVQPTLQGGYRWDLGAWHLDLTAGLGVEVNVDTDGEDVGEGAIALIGFTLTP